VETRNVTRLSCRASLGTPEEVGPIHHPLTPAVTRLRAGHRRGTQASRLRLGPHGGLERRAARQVRLHPCRCGDCASTVGSPRHLGEEQRHQHGAGASQRTWARAGGALPCATSRVPARAKDSAACSCARATHEWPQ
jgi:hypothetical protein